MFKFEYITYYYIKEIKKFKGLIFAFTYYINHKNNNKDYIIKLILII